MKEKIQLIKYRLYNTTNVNIEVYERVTTLYGNSGDGKTYLFSSFKDVFYNDIHYKFIDYTNKEEIRKLKNIKGKIIWIDNGDVILSKEDKMRISKDNSNYYIINCRNTEGLCINAYKLAKVVKESNNTIHLEFPYLDCML